MKALISISLPRTLFGRYSLLRLGVTDRVSLILLWLIVLFGGCEAQSGLNPGLIVIATFMGLGGIFTITCICIVFCTACYQNCKKISRSRGNSTHIGSFTYSHPYQASNQANSGLSYPAYQVQNGFNSSSTQEHYPSTTPTGATSYSTSHTIPSESVSLPEATLHQGDAPPAYEEAVGMKTIDVDVSK